MNAVGKAASFAAVGIAAGVVMSALAIDITDAAVAGAIVAAGVCHVILLANDRSQHHDGTLDLISAFVINVAFTGT